MSSFLSLWLASNVQSSTIPPVQIMVVSLWTWDMDMYHWGSVLEVPLWSSAWLSCCLPTDHWSSTWRVPDSEWSMSVHQCLTGVHDTAKWLSRLPVWLYVILRNTSCWYCGSVSSTRQSLSANQQHLPVVQSLPYLEGVLSRSIQLWHCWSILSISVWTSAYLCSTSPWVGSSWPSWRVCCEEWPMRLV